MAAAAGKQGDAAVRAALDRLLQAPEVSGARVALAVSELSGASSILRRGADRILNPASNSKLVTASFVLSVLGPEFRFQTPWMVDAQGRLHLVGSFDPSITSEALLEAARTRGAPLQTARAGRAIIRASTFRGGRS